MIQLFPFKQTQEVECHQCDNPFPYKCDECMNLVYDCANIPEPKVSIASGEDCYASN